MLAITIVICIFLFLTTALILSTIEKKYIVNDELVEILEKKSNPDSNPYFHKGGSNEKTI